MKFLMSALLLFVVAGFPQDLNASLAPLKLGLNWKAEPQFGGFYASQVLGLFEKEKLNVQVLEGGSGTPTIQMLAAGQVDYAVISADELVLAHDRGTQDLVALFATYQVNPQAILVHAEKKYQRLEEVLLDPKATLLWQAGLPYALFLKKKTPLKCQTAPYSGGLASFEKDPNLAQQCFVTSEPLVAEKKGLKIQTFLISESGYNPYTTVLATRREKITQNKSEVVKLVQAVRKGWNFYLQDPLATNAWMQKLNPAMDAETFAQSAEVQKKLIRPAGLPESELGKMNKKRWQDLTQQLFDLGLIKSRPAVDKMVLTESLESDK